MISIENLRNTQPIKPYDIIVDRRSVIGNPFRMNNEDERDDVCDKYDEWINDKIKNNDIKVINELNRINDIYNTYGVLRLFCRCVPKRCHAISIQKILYSWNIMEF